MVSNTQMIFLQYLIRYAEFAVGDKMEKHFLIRYAEFAVGDIVL